MPYFGKPVGRVKIQTSKNSQQYYKTKTTNKRFIIQHAKFLCPCGRISRIFISGECVTEVCKAERNWRGKSSELIGQQQTNLYNRSSGVQIPRDICTRLGRYLYSMRCSLDNNFSINLLAFYHECRSLIGYGTHVLFNN